jgi:formamidopyrimidine-DNA glycosylase
MGAPTSALSSEVYIQHLEHTSIADILNKHKIIHYYRYVDDILTVYDQRKTNIINMLENFNAIHPKLKFTIEQQTQNRINYLDLTIKKNQNKLNFEIYRKPTTTDLILRNISCHPYKHKKLAINYLYNRLNTYKITEENKKKDKEIIRQILNSNEYPHAN